MLCHRLGVERVLLELDATTSVSRLVSDAADERVRVVLFEDEIALPGDLEAFVSEQRFFFDTPDCSVVSVGLVPGPVS